jgi:hypothetical protein
MPHVSFDAANCTKLKPSPTSGEGATLASSEVANRNVRNFLLKCFFVKHSTKIYHQGKFNTFSKAYYRTKLHNRELFVGIFFLAS